MSRPTTEEHAPPQRLAQREGGDAPRRRFTPPPPPPGRRPRATSAAPGRRRSPRRPRPARARSAARPRGSRPRTRACRSRSRPRRRSARLSSSGVPAATSSPRAMIATRSQTSSTSDSRCEFSSTATPRLAQVLEQPPHGAPAGRVERAGRLVEQQHARAADHRLRDPEPLLHALRHRRRRAAPSASARPTALEQPLALGGAAVRRPRGAGACRAARPRSASRGSGTARRGSRARGAPPASRPARRAIVAAPAVGRTSPQAIFTSVDLPAPFGPSRPTSSPSPTSRLTPLRALDRPVGLVKVGSLQDRGPWPSIVPDDRRRPASIHRRRCAGTASGCTCSTRRGCPPRRS